MADQATFRIWRGDNGNGKFVDYTTEISSGMVVLDAVHSIQQKQANDIAVRWNCKAGKCGSCSAEINGKPRLMCMTRLNTLDLTQPVTVEPMKAFPHVKDLVTDVSWNYRVKMKIAPFKPRKPDAADGDARYDQVGQIVLLHKSPAGYLLGRALYLPLVKRWSAATKDGSLSQ